MTLVEAARLASDSMTQAVSGLAGVQQGFRSVTLQLSKPVLASDLPTDQTALAQELVARHGLTDPRTSTFPLGPAPVQRPDLRGDLFHATPAQEAIFRDSRSPFLSESDPRLIAVAALRRSRATWIKITSLPIPIKSRLTPNPARFFPEA